MIIRLTHQNDLAISDQPTDKERAAHDAVEAAHWTAINDMERR